MDDSTELSTAEGLALLNKVYREILAKRNWKFLRSIASGTIVGTDLSLPADFDEFVDNYSYADNSAYATGSYVFVGDSRQPYKIIDINQRNRYVGSTAHCYYDSKNSKLVFMTAPTETTADYDYKYTPDDIEAGTSPVIPSRFQSILIHGMAVDDNIIQQSPKNKSYAPENQARYDDWLKIMSNWDIKQL